MGLSHRTAMNSRLFLLLTKITDTLYATDNDQYNIITEVQNPTSSDQRRKSSGSNGPLLFALLLRALLSCASDLSLILSKYVFAFKNRRSKRARASGRLPAQLDLG